MKIITSIITLIVETLKVKSGMNSSDTSFYLLLLPLSNTSEDAFTFHDKIWSIKLTAREISYLKSR